MSETGPDATGRDEKVQREAKALKDQLERELEVDDLAWLMSDKRGRRFVWRLLTNAGIYRLSFVSGDAMATAFREGNRSYGLHLVDQLQRHCPERFSEMQQEAIENERRLEKRKAR